MTAPRIMVDAVTRWPHAKPPFRMGSAHLTVDGSTPEHLAALHAFAERLGLQRSWFQAGSRVPHYDLTPAKQAQAIALGAELVDAREQARLRLLAGLAGMPRPPRA